MKKILFIYIMLAYSICNAQEFTHLADSATSEIILQKYLKSEYFRNAFLLQDRKKINTHSNRFITESWLDQYGDKHIRRLTYALGQWAKKLDFAVYKSYYANPWQDQGYELYQIHIPKHSAVNDSIAGHTVYRNYDSRSPRKYEPITWACEVVAYNAQTGDLKPANVSSYFFEIELHKASDEDLFKKLNPNYTYCPREPEKEIELFEPKGKDSVRMLLQSELMKNIFAYRILRSGILDSLIESEKRLKDHVFLFPLLDSLLPDYNEELFLDAEEIDYFSSLKIWRFYYPGKDYIRNVSSNRYRTTTWDKYIPLKPEYYVVAYDPTDKLVHFLSGDNIFLSRIVPRFYQESKVDTVPNSEYRKHYLSYKMLSLFSENYDEVTAKHKEKILSYKGEDSNSWYYTLHTEIPKYKVFERYENGLLSELFFKILYPNVKKCTYEIRMNKKNKDDLTIKEIKCEEGEEEIIYYKW